MNQHPNQEIHIYRTNGFFYMTGNGDQDLMDMANGTFKRGEMVPLPKKKSNHFIRAFRCLYAAIRAQVKENKQKRYQSKFCLKLPFLCQYEDVR